MHADIKLDVQKSLVNQKDVCLKTSDMSVDLDSVLIILAAPLQPAVIKEIENRVNKITQSKDEGKSTGHRVSEQI